MIGLAPDHETQPALVLLIATDCIYEGQNLQDCEFLVNYDIHRNRFASSNDFGRIDRIASTKHANPAGQLLANMGWTNTLTSGPASADAWCCSMYRPPARKNVIEFQAGKQMNDLEYRRSGVR
jgi:hypothetical protein